MTVKDLFETGNQAEFTYRGKEFLFSRFSLNGDFLCFVTKDGSRLSDLQISKNMNATEACELFEELEEEEFEEEEFEED